MKKARLLLLVLLFLLILSAISAQPSVTLNQPNGLQVIGKTYSVDFNVYDSNSAELRATLYYSENSGDFNYLIADLNLNDHSNYPGLSCDSTIWLTSTNCTYDWNLYRQGVSVKDSSLVLYMPLDTYSFRDFSLQANNGTATTFDYTSSSGVVTGKHNRAMKFDGADDYISIADTDRLDIRTSDFTIELWAQRDASGSTHVLVDKRSDATSGYVLQFNSSDQIEAQVCDGSCITITSTSTITDTGWHYIVATFDRSASAQIYLDGVANGSAVSISSIDSNNINTSTALRIGARSYGTLANVMSGKIDEVRIYDKLLSAAEIRKRYSMIQENDANRILDGNYYVDLNVWNTDDLNASDSSDNSFAVDNTAPFTYDDAPTTTQEASFTLTFTCRDDYTDQNLVSYWKLDEGTGTTATDSQGSNNGTISGASWTSGKINYGLEFDGTDDYVDLPDLNPDWSNGFSVCAWVFYDSFKNWSRIIDFGQGQNNDNIVFANELTGDDLVLSIRINDSTEARIDADNVLETGKWMFLCGTVDGSNNGKIYKNGVLVKSGTVYTPQNLNRTYNYIGRSNWSADSNFDGKIDEVQIYNRALDANEVYKHYMYGVASGNYSDCNYVKYRIDNGKWRQSSAVVINFDGNHKVDYYSVDKAGNEEAVRTTYAPLILAGHTFNLGLKFDGNWWSSIVHIPGFVSDQNMQDTLTQTLSQGSTFDYVAFYLNNLLIGLVSTGATYTTDITNVYPTTFNIYMQQAHRAGVDEEFFLALTSGDYRALEGKKEAVRNNEFLDRVQPAFGVPTSAIYTLTIGLDYYDSNVDINGNLHLGPGTHSLVIKNQGASGEKVVISISRD